MRNLQLMPNRLERARVRPVPLMVSLVVPVLDEEAAIAPFVARLEEVFAGLGPGCRHEIVFVNDGSRDGTEVAIRALMAWRSGIRLVNLSRNFGKDAALSAGLEHARGDVVIPMDVDLQDPPELIPRMIAHWRAGAQVVNARRTGRSGDGWARRLTAAAFYRVFNALAERPIPRDVGDFRLLDRQVVEVLRGMGERARFSKALFGWVGFETAEIGYERPARRTGRSAWGWWRLWNFALDGIFAASTTPLRIWSYLGITVSAVAFAYALFIFLRTVILGADTPGYASTVILILTFGGLNLLAIGIIGEYVGRIYTEVRGRPLYVVRSVHEAAPGAGPGAQPAVRDATGQA